MLWFERHVVDRLVTTNDERRRRAVTDHVDGTLGAMPEHLRLSIGAASVVLGGWARVTGRTGTRVVRALDNSPIPQFRQYVRLFRSLVLFAEQELP